jgi:hypothetical protein
LQTSFAQYSCRETERIKPLFMSGVAEMDNDSGVSASNKIRRDLSKEKEDLRTTSRDQLVLNFVLIH